MTADLEQQQTKQSNATTTYQITRIVPRSALPGEVVRIHGVFPYVNTESSDVRAKCPISLHFPGHQMVYPDAIEVLDAKPGFCTVVSLTIPPAYKGLENDKVHIFLFVNGRIVPSERPVKFQYRTTIRRIEWAACSIPLLPHQPAGGSERKKISTLNGILSQQIPRSVYGRTILHLYALERKDQKVITLLKSIVCPRQRKQIVNIYDNAGYSLLHIAAARGCLDLAKTLLQMGADPTLKCNRGQTPSDLCAHTPLLQRILLLATQLYPTPASPSVSPSSFSASCPSESRQPLAPLSYITTSVIPTTTPVSSLLVKRSFEVSVKEDPTMRKRRKFF